MEHTLSAVADPAQANLKIAQVLEESAPVKTPTMPTAPRPPDNIITLPGGGIDSTTGELVTEAEVRELTGVDEEALGRVPDDQPARFFNTILKLGVVRIGQDLATASVLDNLMLGDRDALLLAVRRATWGDDVEMGVYCPTCEEVFQYRFFLSTDVPVKELKDPTQRVFTVDISSGHVATLHLPNGHTQMALLAAGVNANRGVLNTTLLVSCLEAIDDLPVMGAPPVQRLSVRDRTKLLTELAERSFGPQLGEVSVSCQVCGEKNAAPMSLGTLFPL